MVGRTVDDQQIHLRACRRGRHVLDRYEDEPAVGNRILARGVTVMDQLTGREVMRRAKTRELVRITAPEQQRWKARGTQSYKHHRVWRNRGSNRYVFSRGINLDRVAVRVGAVSYTHLTLP